MANLVVLACVAVAVLAIFSFLPAYEKHMAWIGGYLARFLRRIYPPARIQRASKRSMVPLLVSGRVDPPVVVYGAGKLGRDFYRRSKEHYIFSFQESVELEAEVLWYVDDDPSSKGRWIEDRKVLGSLDDLAELLKRQKGTKNEVKALVIAIAELEKARAEMAVKICAEFGIPCLRFGFGLQDTSSMITDCDHLLTKAPE